MTWIIVRIRVATLAAIQIRIRVVIPICIRRRLKKNTVGSLE